jgi:hypothetical protein
MHNQQRQSAARKTLRHRAPLSSYWLINAAFLGRPRSLYLTCLGERVYNYSFFLIPEQSSRHNLNAPTEGLDCWLPDHSDAEMRICFVRGWSDFF